MDIEALKSGGSDFTEVVTEIISSNKKRFNSDVYRQYFGVNHKVNSTMHREDKKLRVPIGDNSKDENGELKLTTKIAKVSRISVEFQKLIVTTATSFCAGGGVILKANATNKQKQMLIKAKDVWKRAKCEYLNYEVAETLYAQKEVAEIWYTNSNKELRCNIYKPSDGYELLPVFDGNRDLVLFGVKSVIIVDSEEVQIIDLYTDSTLTCLYLVNDKWVLRKPIVILKYGKMPVIYHQHDEVVYEGVQSLIERYEVLLSNFADTNDYNGSPILFGKGEINGYGEKGEQGKFIQGEGDADLKYISNNAVPESVKLEFETVKNLIYTLTLTPELSFDIMVNLGNVSGLAMDRILTGAHLKAKKMQNGAYGVGIQRRLNFLVTAISNMYSELSEGADLYITPQFNLFRISSEAEKITSMLLANGNLPLIDHKSSIEEVGLVENPEEAMILIDTKLKTLEKPKENANNAPQNL